MICVMLNVSMGCFVVAIWLLFQVWPLKIIQDWRRRQLRFRQTASKLPGPRGFPLIGNALELACKPEEIMHRVLKLCTPYEGLSRFWLGPKLVVVVKKPVDLKRILQNQNAAYKEDMYNILETFFGRGLVTSSGPTHRIHRKLIVGMLNGKTLESFVEYFDKHSLQCVKRLENRIDTGEFDIHPYMEHCAMDIALDTVMGTPGIVQQNGHKELISQIASTYKLVAERMLKLIAQKKKEYYASKIGSDKRQLKLLEQLIEHNENNHLMDAERLRDEIFTLFLAVEDSTTTMSCFVFLMLGMNSNVQEKVRTELHQVLGDESVTAKNLSKLNYLDMVIKETLRLFPLRPMMIRKLIADVDLDSCTLPEGCSVAILPFLTHRDPEYWPNPNAFDPDRFDPGNSADRNPYAYLPFSGGPRGCIGQQFAMLQLKATVVNLLRKYRFHSNATLDGIKLRSDIVIRSIDGYKISIIRV